MSTESTRLDITNIGVLINDRLYRPGDTFEDASDEMKRCALAVEEQRKIGEVALCDLLSVATRSLKAFSDSADSTFLEPYMRLAVSMTEHRRATQAFLACMFDRYNRWMPLAPSEGRVVVSKDPIVTGTIQAMMASVLRGLTSTIIADLTLMMALSRLAVDEPTVKMSEFGMYYVQGKVTRRFSRIADRMVAPLIRLATTFWGMRTETVAGAVMVETGDEAIVYPMSLILRGMPVPMKGANPLMLTAQIPPPAHNEVLVTVYDTAAKAGTVVRVNPSSGASNQSSNQEDGSILILAKHSDIVVKTVKSDEPAR